MRSVNENALAVKGKVHCLAATLDRQGISEQKNKLYFAFPFCPPLSKDKIKFNLKGDFSNANSSHLLSLFVR